MTPNRRDTARRVSGPIGSDEAADLERFAADGGRVILTLGDDDSCGADLGGVRVVDDLPRGEWFVTLIESPASARLEHEVPIASELRTLRVESPDVDVCATTSVRFSHHPTIVRRRVGDGFVITLGIADDHELAQHPTLSRFVERLASPIGEAGGSQLGVGVVGYGPFGGMGYLHGLAATETDGLCFVAAADPVPDRLDAARVDFPDLTGHESAASLADDPRVDVAVIATPPVHHHELALMLLRAGKHVVVEKPMCLRRVDADELIATGSEVDRTITVHQSRRWDADWLTLRHVIDRGDIGQIFNIETFVGGFEHPCRAWHSEESVSGGAIYDWGSHHVDWIIQLYGAAPARVLCSTHDRVWRDTTNVDQLSLWMQWSDGREATFRQSDVCAIRRPKFHVEGTSGTIEGYYRPLRTDSVSPGRGHVMTTSHHAEAPVDLTIATYDGRWGVRESMAHPCAVSPWGFHRNLADHLLLGEPLAVPATQSRDVVTVLEAGHRSGANGGELIELAEQR